MTLSSSGEFHTFRLPVPDLWLDIFQKMVAAGLNGVRYASRDNDEYIQLTYLLFTVYTYTVRLVSLIYLFQTSLMSMSGALTHPAPGVLDFNDWRALQPMYDAAKLAGIWIVLRPG